MTTSRGVLFVGNFLSATRKHRQYCEDLSERLESRHWRVLRTSNRELRFHRLADMVHVTWARRRDYAFAHLDLFSGSAFLWAEAICFELGRLGKPVVITLHGGRLPDFARRWPRRTRRLLSSAQTVTAPSGYLRDAMQAYAHAIVEIPNAIDAAQYRSAPRPRPLRRLIWLRAFHAIYRPMLAIDVLARVAERDRTITLVMVGADKGDGSLQACRRRAAELGVTGNIRFIEGIPKSEVADYLTHADVFLNTSDVDNTPISVLEAMASGLCVVSTTAGGIPFMLQHEREGLLVPLRDAAAMAAAVQRLLDNDELANRLAAAARQRALQSDWKPVLDRWEELFTRVTSDG